MKILAAVFFAYLVSDLKTSAAFYREILGLRQTEYKEEWQWAEFDCGNITLTLYGGMALPERVLGGRVALAVDDIQDAWRNLQEQGVTILRPPFELSGCRHLEILDPDRNMIILHQRKDGTNG